METETLVVGDFKMALVVTKATRIELTFSAITILNI
jgi:hypothetical protein